MKGAFGAFPGGLVVRTLNSHCEGPGFSLWLGNKIQVMQCCQKQINKLKEMNWALKTITDGKTEA